MLSSSMLALSSLLPIPRCWGCGTGFHSPVQQSGGALTLKNKRLEHRSSPSARSIRELRKFISGQCCKRCAALRLLVADRATQIRFETTNNKQWCYRTCKRCGLSTEGEHCIECQAQIERPEGQHPIRLLRSLLLYSGQIRSIIHQMKFFRHFRSADFLGELLTYFLQPSKVNFYDSTSDRLITAEPSEQLENDQETLNRPAPFPDGVRWDFIVPIPISLAAFQERGYAPLDRLAAIVAQSLRLPMETRMLIINRKHISQRQLSLEDRRINMEGAFRAPRKLAAKKRILLLDDVLTTGATATAAATALKSSGAKSVDLITIARTVSPYRRHHLRDKLDDL